MSNLTFPLFADFDFADSYGNGSGILLKGFKFFVGFKISSFEEDGPGGGWPNFVIEVQDQGELDRLLDKYFENQPECREEYLELLAESQPENK